MFVGLLMFVTMAMKGWCVYVCATHGQMPAVHEGVSC